jgi:hypothetical protein
MDTMELFKFYLDETLPQHRPREAIGDREDVRAWFKHFFTALHHHIQAHLTDHPWLVDWNLTKVEYIFGLSALWKAPLVNDFKDIVEQAGFGSEPNCSIVMRLTEGEAAAVCTAKKLGRKYRVMPTTCRKSSMLFANFDLQEGDIVLVCDAGGGTTVCQLHYFLELF